MRRITLLFLFLVSTVAGASTVLITGSNSGIGYELARQYADEGWHVIATHRRDTIPESLATLSGQYDNVQVETLDVTDMAGIDALATKLAGQPIDVLLSNAAIVGTFDQPEQQFGTLDFDLFHRFMDVNSAGPLRVAQSFYENVKISKQRKIIGITTGAASLTRTAQESYQKKYGIKYRYWYNMSKAALNMGYIGLANDARSDGVAVLLLSPGMVRVTRTADYKLTKEGQEFAREVDVAAADIRKRIAELSIETSGTFINGAGRISPW
jgi:NAD(P)-dependent dehydrogenase (short-subunit alcohol dehydrogenase family)